MFLWKRSRTYQLEEDDVLNIYPRLITFSQGVKVSVLEAELINMLLTNIYIYLTYGGAFYCVT
jgi:hypothetical protein